MFKKICIPSGILSFPESKMELNKTHDMWKAKICYPHFKFKNLGCFYRKANQHIRMELAVVFWKAVRNINVSLGQYQMPT